MDNNVRKLVLINNRAKSGTKSPHRNNKDLIEGHVSSRADNYATETMALKNNRKQVVNGRSQH